MENVPGTGLHFESLLKFWARRSRKDWTFFGKIFMITEGNPAISPNVLYVGTYAYTVLLYYLLDRRSLADFVSVPVTSLQSRQSAAAEISITVRAVKRSQTADINSLHG